MEHPIAGRKQSPEHVAKRAAALRGAKRTEAQKADIAAATREAMKRPEVQAKLAAPRPAGSAAKSGEKNPMFGRTVSDETRAKRSAAMKARGRGDEKNPGWKGDSAGPAAMHIWLRRRYPLTGTCSECGEEKRTEYAFLRHPEPYTRERSDYAEMCRRCHMRLDIASGHRPKPPNRYQAPEPVRP